VGSKGIRRLTGVGFNCRFWVDKGIHVTDGDSIERAVSPLQKSASCCWPNDCVQRSGRVPARKTAELQLHSAWRGCAVGRPVQQLLGLREYLLQQLGGQSRHSKRCSHCRTSRQGIFAVSTPAVALWVLRWTSDLSFRWRTESRKEFTSSFWTPRSRHSMLEFNDLLAASSVCIEKINGRR